MNDPASPVPCRKAMNIRKVENLLGNLLRVGVVTSLGLMATGIIVSFIRHPEYLTNPEALEGLTQAGSVFPQTLHEVADELLHFRGRAIMILGLLLLILTPVLRVAVSAIAYMVAHDWVFVLITGFVLLVLIVSFLVGAAG